MWRLLTALTAALAALAPASAVGTCAGSRAQLSRCFPDPAADGGWRSGEATYYMSYESDPVGAGGRRLEAFRSAAVPEAEFERREGEWVEIRGIGSFRVDDACAGGGCRDFDIFVGDAEENAHRLPGWELGNMPIQFRWT